MSWDTNYRYGKKNNWRRWCWNRIVERTDRTGDGIVLLLAGEDALDIPIAKTKGFPIDSMIAVERNKSAIRSLRENGVQTIDGDLLSVLTTWPTSKVVSVIHADFCCGLEPTLAGVFAVVNQHPAMRKAVFSINLQRGREHGGMGAYIDAINRKTTTSRLHKHRGFLLFLLILAEQVERAREFGTHVTQAIYDQMGAALAKRTCPAFYSYAGERGTVFDSIVFKSPTAESTFDGPWDEAWNKLGRGRPQRRRTAAILAHRTMRMSRA